LQPPPHRSTIAARSAAGAHQCDKARSRDLGGTASALLITESGETLDKRSVQSLCSILKVFFRYLYRAGLDGPRSGEGYRITSPIPALDLAALDCLVTYGLHAREVGALTLDDIDWKHDRIDIRGARRGTQLRILWHQSSAKRFSTI
jgi:hypothetical protein